MPTAALSGSRFNSLHLQGSFVKIQGTFTESTQIAIAAALSISPTDFTCCCGRIKVKQNRVELWLVQLELILENTREFEVKNLFLIETWPVCGTHTCGVFDRLTNMSVNWSPFSGDGIGAEAQSAAVTHTTRTPDSTQK